MFAVNQIVGMIPDVLPLQQRRREDAKFMMAQIWGDATASTASESVVGKAIEAEV